MSYNEETQVEASDYWDAPSEDVTQDQKAQAASQEPAFDPSKYVPVEQFQQTQQQLQQMQQGLSQALGQQTQEPQWDAEGAKVADKYLESKGYMTQEAYRTERANEAAQEAGYVNSAHLESAFNSMFFDAQAKGNAQLEAELTKIGQAYQAGNTRGAIKQFQAIQDRTQAPIQNQTFGHQPSQQQTPKTQFASEAAFDAHMRTLPFGSPEYFELLGRVGGANNPYPKS